MHLFLKKGTLGTLLLPYFENISHPKISMLKISLFKNFHANGCATKIFCKTAHTVFKCSIFMNCYVYKNISTSAISQIMIFRAAFKGAGALPHLDFWKVDIPQMELHKFICFTCSTCTHQNYTRKDHRTSTLERSLFL